MRKSFRGLVNILKEYVHRFDPGSQQHKTQALRNLSEKELSYNKDLITYFENLLFILAYPSDPGQVVLAEREVGRITRLLKIKRNTQGTWLENTGMPFTDTITRFSHDDVKWLLAHPHCSTTFHSFVDPSLTLNEVLRLALPSLERSITTVGWNNIELLDALKVPAANRLPFLINTLSAFDHIPEIKDHLFDRLEVFVRVRPKDHSFSKAYNRMPVAAPYFTTTLLKNFDIREMLQQPLGPPVLLKRKEKEAAIRVVKNAMAITARETDPTTFMDPHSFRLYHGERGISVAIYGMIPSRQLPLESYVGFTAFRNGFPAAYGGAWIFGERAGFGINIFESFRSGESGFMMAQILRVYKAVFHLQYFEIEPYQFGLDNPDGIETGAFWFYYKFGFRPLDSQLRKIAKLEKDKMKSRKDYRTSHDTLIRFTESPMALNPGRRIPASVSNITSRVTHMIQQVYNGDRGLAVEVCRKKFLAKTRMKKITNASEEQVLNETALWAEAMDVNAKEKLELMIDMIKTKPKDLYTYQDLLLQFFSSPQPQPQPQPQP